MRHAVLALAPLVLVAQAAHAGPKVYVAPYGIVGPEVPADLSSQTATLISDELKNHKSLEVLKGPSLGGSAAPVADSGDAAKAEKALGRAEGLVKQGDAAMLKLNFGGAAAKYRAAVKLYLQNVGALESFDTINYARLSLATALFREGKEEEGEEALTDVIRLDPERTLDPAAYPPVFVRTYQKIQKDMLRKTRGAISVVSQPAGAEVHLDGKKVGVTPLLIKDLIRGPHHVKLISAGEEAPWTSSVDVTPTKVASIDADLGGKVQGPVGEVVATLARGTLDKKALGTIAAVAGSVGATHVVFGALSREADAYTVKSYLYEVESKKVAGLKEMSFDLDMLGAAIEVFKLAEEIDKGTGALPEALSLPVEVFEKKAAPETPVIAEVSAAPAEAPVAAAAPAPVAPSGPIAPARGPVEPARGPIMPVQPAQPVQPRDEAPPPRVRQRDSLASGPVEPATASSGPGAPIAPVGPITGVIAPLNADPEEPVEPARARQVNSLTERKRLEAADLESGSRYSAVDIGEIVIPKDEVEKKEGWPWWAWTLTGVLAAGAIGAGGYYAVDRGLFVGAADDAAVTFSW
ncbi:MAG: PEGA domain-containing protein [Deltaproteobacteria bacterium]|nr:PEGA domain-containing protein [Deltaproteobacteria bacterium]